MVKKQIVYWAQKFGIWSLFVSIQFKIDRIVHDKLNITVTYLVVQLCSKPKMPIKRGMRAYG